MRIGTGTPREEIGPVIAVMLAVMAAAPGWAAAATCQQAKLTAAGKKTAGKLGCHATAAKTGAAVGSACLDGVEAKFDAAFAKADARGGCPVTGNDGVVEAAVDQCVTAILAALGAGSPPPPPAWCLQAKMKASGKKASAELKCWAKAAATSSPVVPACLTTAEAKFGAAFAKAELRGGCAQTGDAAAVEAAVDACVADVVALLPPPASTTTTIATTTTTLPACGGSEPPSMAGITAAHDAVRASASPVPSPPLDPLCWSSTVAASAQSWADGCRFAHDPDLGSLGYGQNIYAVSDASGNPPLDAVGAWASEAADYDYASNTCSAVCGHYTQLVWRSTRSVGCGTKFCTTGSPFGPSFPDWTIVVCDYAPPGNFVGERPY